MKQEIKTAEDVAIFAKEAATEIETLKSDLAAKDERTSQLADEITTLTDKLKTVQAMIQDKFAIEREDTEEGRLYKLGSLVSSMVNKEGRSLSRLGAIPSSVTDDGSFGVRKGWEAKYEAQWRKTYRKSALSSDPLTSDGSDDSSFYGAYLVPTDVIADVMRVAADASVMMPLVTHRPVRGITTYIPTSTDAFAFVAQTDQETAFTEETLTFARSTLTVVTYAMWIAITEQTDEDSLIAMGAFIRTMCGEAWGTAFDTLALSNATYGAMATSGVNQVIMGDGDTAFSNVSSEYLDSLVGELDTRDKRSGARYFMAPTVWDYIANERDAVGNYAIRRFSESAPLAARGYPVTLSDGMPDSGDSAISTDFVAFGNPKHIVAGDRVGFEFKVYDGTESSMKYGQIYLRARVRQAMVNTVPSAWSKLTTAAS
uniref:Putative capsid protein n=1 Tax=viral metagenome TaxID=1070528 RepID=A0A6M3IGQ2_9ZZZZ